MQLISTVDCTDIMDMLDIHTPMDTWDIMESVKLSLRQSLKPILLISIVGCTDIMDMLDIPTHMDTSDTMDKHQSHQMKLPQKMDTNHSMLSSSVPTMFQCLMYSW